MRRRPRPLTLHRMNVLLLLAATVVTATCLQLVLRVVMHSARAQIVVRGNAGAAAIQGTGDVTVIVDPDISQDSALSWVSCHECLDAGNTWCVTTNKCSRADMSSRACPAFTAEENAFYIKKGFGVPCNIFRRAADKGSPFCTNRRGGEIWIIPERPSKGRCFRSRGPNDLCWPYNCGSTGRAARWEFDYEEGWIPVHRFVTASSLPTKLRPAGRVAIYTL